MVKAFGGICLVALLVGFAFGQDSVRRFAFDRSNPVCSLSGYDVGYKVADQEAFEVVKSITAEFTTFDLDFAGYDPGEYTLAVRAMDVNGLKSDWSNEVKVCISPAVLLPPTGCREITDVS